MSDDDLYRAYLSGDSEAGDQLMLRHGDALTAYLDAFLHNAQDAEDLMLDCFTVILVDKPRIEDGHFHAYLFRVARNKAVRLWRLKRKRGEFSLDEALLAQGGSPEEIVWRSERDRAVHRCLNRIAPQYREALWLIFDGRLSYAQAAEVLRCNTKKVDNLLTCGKKQLRKELEREGIVGEDF
ncbi:MAG: RNA polymerase sigma factor [Clostridia bacterium]|nr:RNA polymerase sigma factor [Clostridia bacterium]